MKRFLYAGVLVVLIASLAVLQNRAVGQTPAGTSDKAGADQYRAMLNTYCVGCHSTRAKTGGLSLEGLDLQAAADNAQIWEKVLRKLRGRLMPPPGSPQPQQNDIAIRSLPGWRTTSIPMPKVRRRATFRLSVSAARSTPRR